MSLQEMIEQAGVIGAGGAGFPTHAKLTASAEYILLNGAECEPLLRVDQQLMAQFPEEIVQGFAMASSAVDAKKAVIGIKNKHREVIAILQEKISALGLSGVVEVWELPDIYPAGDEQVLVYEITGRVVPEGGIPLHVGCVVVNSETCLNIYYGSVGIPVTQKYLTLAGDIPHPVTVQVPVGTPVMEVLKLSGIEDFSAYAVIDGGPMMGAVMTDLTGYISKKNKGFIILKKDHVLIRKKTMSKEQLKRINRSACEQCRMCTDLCPRYLIGHQMEPHKMMRTINYNCSDLGPQRGAYLCCQCGLCELFACPVGLFPKAANMQVKDQLISENIRWEPTDRTLIARKGRAYRLVPSKRLVIRLGLKKFDLPAPIEPLTVTPAIVGMRTDQHVGKPAVPVVSPGDHVSAGQLIGKIPEGSLGANVHASISGTVVDSTPGLIRIRRD